jgi:drug/metabolite transporter (DMT)-like permease
VNRLKEIWEMHSADLTMTSMVFIWGLHFIVVKDGLSDFAPLTFNAIRFTIAAPILILVAWRILPKMRLSKRDFWLMVFLGLLGPTSYQIVFVLG